LHLSDILPTSFGTISGDYIFDLNGVLKVDRQSLTILRKLLKVTNIFLLIFSLTIGKISADVSQNQTLSQIAVAIYTDQTKTKIKPEWLVHHGLYLYVLKYFDKNKSMNSVFNHVLSNLSKNDRAKLLRYWQKFVGTPENFNLELERLYKDSSADILTLREDLFAQNAYLNYVLKHYPGENMKKAFSNVMAVLPKSDRARLQLVWHEFIGTTKEYELELERLYKDPNAKVLELKEELLTTTGYLEYTKKYYSGQNMLKVFINAMAVLPKDDKEKLQQVWQNFNGTTKEYELELERLYKDPNAKVFELREELLTPKGYHEYAKTYYPKQNMKKVFMNVVAVLPKDDKEKLQQVWQSFNGTPEEYELELERLYKDPNAKALELKEELLTTTGYLKYAKEHYSGQNMKKAFNNAMAVLPKNDKAKLQQVWQNFNGTPAEYELELERLYKDPNAEVLELKEELLTPTGYLEYAKTYYPGHNMVKAFINVMAVLPQDDKARLQQVWQTFGGTTEEYEKILAMLFGQEENSVKPKYHGKDGLDELALKLSKQKKGEPGFIKMKRNIRAVAKTFLEELDWEKKGKNKCLINAKAFN